MPTLQTKTSTDSAAAVTVTALQQHETHSSSNNNYQETKPDSLRMPTVLRDVDELVNDIKWNLKLRGTAEGNVNNGLLRCCFEVEAASPTTTTTERELRAGGDKMKKTSLRKLTRIKTAPYYVADKTCCSSSNNNNHLCTKDEAEIENRQKTCQTCQLLHHRRHHHNHLQQKKTSDDPYELLQELLKEGGLIKEAVRRLNYIGGDENKCFDYDQDDYEPSTAVVV
ncbi:hypothetical protein CHUAL_003987 [Chamberlinius hualienensis]